MKQETPIEALDEAINWHRSRGTLPYDWTEYGNMQWYDVKRYVKELKAENEKLERSRDKLARLSAHVTATCGGKPVEWSGRPHKRWDSPHLFDKKEDAVRDLKKWSEE